MSIFVLLFKTHGHHEVVGVFSEEKKAHDAMASRRSSYEKEHGQYGHHWTWELEECLLDVPFPLI